MKEKDKKEIDKIDKLEQKHEIRLLEMGLDNEETQKEALNLLKGCYKRLNLSQETYFADTRENIVLTSIWIIGTYLHKKFTSYPRLFFNATRGSGKTRKLKFIEALAWNGKLQTNMTEAVLFRTANQHTICLDECESISTKEKGAIRELLNAGYKKGSKVQRMRKSFTKDGEMQVVETFDLYSPVTLANISGMEDVLSDRSITLYLEKSDDPSKVNLIEDFDTNPFFLDIKRTLELIKCRLCSVDQKKQWIDVGCLWNVYTLTTHNTHDTLHTLSPLTMPEEMENNNTLTEKQLHLFEKINDAKINARNLELFLPLFLTADLIGENVLNELIEIAKKKVAERKEEEGVENRDIALIDFVSKMPSTLEFKSIRDLTIAFKDYYNVEETLDFITTIWMGKALRRLSLLIEARRLSRGVEVLLNVGKAQEKIKMFKEVKND